VEFAGNATVSLMFPAPLAVNPEAPTALRPGKGHASKSIRKIVTYR